MTTYKCENNEWMKCELISDDDGIPQHEWVPVYTIEVPTEKLLVEYENLLNELSLKETELMKLDEEWKQKEFHYRFISDLDFKELYGKANDDVRKQHAKSECKDLLEKKHALELSVDYLKRYLPFLKMVIAAKIKGT